MDQMSFGNSEYVAKKKKTRRGFFLNEMERVVPWTGLLKVIEPCYPVAGRGRRPYPLKTASGPPDASEASNSRGGLRP
jgi:transposase, IS5 family